MVGQELWQFCADSSSWRPAARDADPHARILRVADLWLLRLAGEGPLAHWSCAEMVYPADVRSAHVAYDHSTGTWRTRHRLLDEHLEKGVIRRLRCAVVWLPRKHDLQLAETLYERFLNAPLPLTT